MGRPYSLFAIPYSLLPIRSPHFFHPSPHPCDTPLTPAHRRLRRTYRSRAGGDAGSRTRNVRGMGRRRRKAVIRVLLQAECSIRFRQPASPRVQRGCRGGHRLTGCSYPPPRSSRVRGNAGHSYPLSSEASHSSGPSEVKRSADVKAKDKRSAVAA